MIVLEVLVNRAREAKRRYRIVFLGLVSSVVMGALLLISLSELNLDGALSGMLALGIFVVCLGFLLVAATWASCPSALLSCSGCGTHIFRQYWLKGEQSFECFLKDPERFKVCRKCNLDLSHCEWKKDLLPELRWQNELYGMLRCLILLQGVPIFVYSLFWLIRQSYLSYIEVTSPYANGVVTYTPALFPIFDYSTVIYPIVVVVVISMLTCVARKVDCMPQLWINVAFVIIGFFQFGVYWLIIPVFGIGLRILCLPFRCVFSRGLREV